MTTKLLVLVILTFLAGLIFAGSSFYFFNKKLKGTAYMALCVGAVTIGFAVFLLLLPQLAPLLALIYMSFLMIAFLILMFAFKNK